jgi:hypothetical protein
MASDRRRHAAEPEPVAVRRLDWENLNREALAFRRLASIGSYCESFAIRDDV